MTSNSKQVVYTPDDSVPVPFDPDVATALVAFHEFQRPDAFTRESIPHIREAMTNWVMTDDQLGHDGAFTVSEIGIPGMPGDPSVALLVCRPSAADGPTPMLYFVHGGGMVVGNYRTGLPEMLDYALELSMCVVSVDYRLAPEHPHPAPVHDTYAGLLWAIENAEILGIDPARVIMAGSSAGGGLAAAVCLLRRDRGDGPILGQMLISPMLDDRNDTISACQNVGIGTWDRNSNETGWTALLGDSRGDPDVSLYAAPARATDLSGLPPTFIDAGSAETFRDEDVTFASRIWQTGGIAELHVWQGGCHGFDIVAPGAPISLEARTARIAWLRRMLS